MKFPYAMLRDFVETTLDAQAIGDLLTMAGFELEGIEEVEGDSVLDIKVVSNRGDGLSVFGLAREVLAKDADATPTALYQQAVARFPIEEAANEVADRTRVTIETPNCTRYACRMFAGVTYQPSPETIQRRLRQSGMRPISLCVDLTNYVMLELGQPLHAFDFDQLRGGRIVVRQATEGETLVTLDEKEHNLKPHHMMICDAEGPVAAAGIMGGRDSEFGEGTTTLLLESAHFVNTSIRKTRKELGFNTESSYRFERSVDPMGVVAALNRFALLLAEFGGPAPIPGVVDVFPAPPAVRQVTLRLERAVRLLGMPISWDEATRYLRALGFGVQGDEPVLEVTIPSWRPDVVREEDLVEELGRVHGFDRIPERLPQGSSWQGGLVGSAKRAKQAREALLRAGFSQVICHSLRAEHPLMDPRRPVIGPRGILDPDMMNLRNSLLPSLADAALRNGGKDLHLFEQGQVFSKGESGYVEHASLAILSTGLLVPEFWQKTPANAADFFSLKGALEAVFAVLHLPFLPAPSDADSRLHPTRQAELALASGDVVGVFGQIHPDVAAAAGLPEATFLAELNLEALLGQAPDEQPVRPISRNPAVRRDMAIQIDKSVPFAKLEAAIREAVGEVLERMWVFDVYSGANIPAGQHSVGVALQMRKHGANFTDEEANQVRELAVEAVRALGATMR